MRFGIVIDPLGAFPETPERALIDAAGLLPSMAIEEEFEGDFKALHEFFAAGSSDADMEKRVLKRYGFPVGSFKGHQEIGGLKLPLPAGELYVPVLQYPDDPPMSPYLVVLQHDNQGSQAMIVYPHAWVLFRPSGNIYRLD